MERLYDDLLKDNKIYLELCEKLYRYSYPLEDYVKDDSADNILITVSRISLKKDEEISNRQIHDFYFRRSHKFVPILREALWACDSDMRNCLETYKDSFIAYDIYVRILNVNDINIKVSNIETITRGLSILSNYPIRIHLFSSIDNYVSYTFLNKEENTPFNIPIMIGLPQRIVEGIKYLKEHEEDLYTLRKLMYQIYGNIEYTNKICKNYTDVLNSKCPLCLVFCNGADKDMKPIEYNYKYKAGDIYKSVIFPKEFSTGILYGINIIFNDKFIDLTDIKNLVFIISEFITIIYKYHQCNDSLRIMITIPKSAKDFIFQEFLKVDDFQDFRNIPIDKIKEIDDTLYSRIAKWMANYISRYLMY